MVMSGLPTRTALNRQSVHYQAVVNRSPDSDCHCPCVRFLLREHNTAQIACSLDR